MTDRFYGYYVIMRAVNHDRPGEATNVGCALYDPEGNQVGCRADTLDRAVARGDLAADRAEGLKDYVLNVLKRYETVASVEQAHRSTGHAMSSIQVGGLCMTVIEPGTLDDIFERYVLGKKAT